MNSKRRKPVMNCPRCQTSLKENALFCGNCGLQQNSPAETKSSVSEETLQSTDRLVGRVLDGKYELLERLGRGGMGAVYKARRRHIGDHVAIKILLEELVTGAESAERFRREARAAAVLRHPNVVSIHDFSDGSDSNSPAYIVMELVDGASLRSLMKSEGKFEPQRALLLMKGICAGVGAAHRRGVIHRDLKPDNIIISAPDRPGENETAKVIDFGIAKLRETDASSALTQTGTLIGTPFYMSPEQCLGDTLDPRSDLYSLGAILYEMLGGVPPFTGTTPAAVIARHLTDDPVPLDELGVATALAHVCRRSLAKKPDDRYQSVDEFYLALAGALGQFGDDRAAIEGATIHSTAPATAAAPMLATKIHQTPTASAMPAISDSQRPEMRTPVAARAAADTVVDASARTMLSKQLKGIGNYALAGGFLVFLISLGVGILLRWLGWAAFMAYDEFALELISIGLRDAMFGVFLGIVVSGLIRALRKKANVQIHRVGQIIVYAACGAIILMAPFVLLRTSLMLIPAGLAIVGLVLGATFYGVRLLVGKFAN